MLMTLQSKAEPQLPGTPQLGPPFPQKFWFIFRNGVCYFVESFILYKI